MATAQHYSSIGRKRTHTRAQRLLISPRLHDSNTMVAYHRVGLERGFAKRGVRDLDSHPPQPHTPTFEVGLRPPPPFSVCFLGRLRMWGCGGREPLIKSQPLPWTIPPFSATRYNQPIKSQLLLMTLGFSCVIIIFIVRRCVNFLFHLLWQMSSAKSKLLVDN